MTTMIGSTVPLLVLFFVASVHAATAAPGNTVTQAPDPKPTDIIPAAADLGSIILPMRAGKYEQPVAYTKDGLDAPDMFSEGFDMCGKFTISPTDSTRDSHYQLAFKPAGAVDVRIDCSPHPERIVVTSDTTDFIDPTVPATAVLKSCMGTFTCGKNPSTPNMVVGTSSTTGASHNFVAPTLGNTNDVCKSGAGAKLMFSNEDSCANDANDYGITTTTGSSNKQRTISRWMGKEKRFRIIRPFLYKGLGEPIKPDVPAWTNSFLKLADDGSKMKNGSIEIPSGYVYAGCDGTCDRGKVIKFTMRKGSWRMMLYLKSQSKGFKLCVSAEHFDEKSMVPICKRSAEMYVLPQQGIVVWPGTGRASLLKMKTDRFGPNDFFVIEVGYGLRDVVDANGKLSSEFYVGNSYREYVTSDGVKFDEDSASRVTVFFETDEDLQQGAGVTHHNIQDASTLVKTEEATNVQQKKSTINGEGKATDGEEKPAEDNFHQMGEMNTTTPRPEESADIITGLEQVVGKQNNNNDSVWTKGKWWTWGIFVGFIIGSLLGMAIIGGIFYVLRRTVYGFWYRGMYKRYGCDASGTTGGITGIGFGQTTTGAITLSKTAADKGGTTGGTTGMTTGGTTGGGTTGGTTGGKTSSSSTTGSTIAM